MADEAGSSEKVAAPAPAPAAASAPAATAPLAAAPSASQPAQSASQPAQGPAAAAAAPASASGAASTTARADPAAAAATLAAANAALAATAPLTGAAPPEQLAAIGVTAPKLFVGQIPRAMKEEAARAMFEPYGKIFDFSLMCDRATGQSRGSAFLTFYRKESADTAMATLHQKVTLPGMSAPLCVKPADSGARKSAAMTSNAKLFIGMLPFQSTEADLRSLFEPFGSIEDVVILRHNDTGNSKGCGFVRYDNTQSCDAAIAELNGKMALPGAKGPLTVKYADTGGQKQQRQQQRLAFGGYAQQAPGMMWGRGMAPMGGMPHMAGAMAAPYGMQGAYPMRGYSMPAAMGMQTGMGGMQPGMGGMPTGMGGMQPGMGGMHTGYGAGVSAAAQQPAPASYTPLPPALAAAGVKSGPSGVGTAPQRQGPANANVFVYNLPNGCTDVQLYIAFASFGNVYSAKVFVDKATGQSKGFGFVSFDNATTAAQSIHAMHGYVWAGQRLRVSLKTARGAAAPY